jgi:threonine aldolase
MAGGVVVPPEVLAGVAEAAREREVASYLDGARLWNAAAAGKVDVAQLAAGFDLVWVAFSKGLGAPGGSILAGPRHLIQRARRYRRIQGGAMRQVGIFAAAAEHALDYHLDGIRVDHANARAIAETLAASPLFELDLDRVQTNIVIFGLAEGAVDAATVVARAGAAGLAVLAMGDRIRVVTHRDVTTEECLEAARTLVRVTAA